MHRDYTPCASTSASPVEPLVAGIDATGGRLAEYRFVDHYRPGDDTEIDPAVSACAEAGSAGLVRLPGGELVDQDALMESWLSAPAVPRPTALPVIEDNIPPRLRA